MFKCELCKKQVAAKSPCKKVVIIKRMFQHPYRPKVQKHWGVDKNGRPKLEWADDKGGRGEQIVREVFACTECAAKWENEHKP
jgi:hypothetical protein